MRIFVTGASGWIGSAVTAELLKSGHQVIGLARSQASADVIAGLGAEVLRGDLDDLDGLRAGAAASEGVIHLGYNHDFSRMGEAARTDLAAITAMSEVLEGTGHPLLIASGVVGIAQGRPGTEQDIPDPSSHPRVANAAATLALADRGIRSIVARFAPTVHGPGDHGFVSVLTGIARDKGVAAYVGDGTNRWPAVHRLDAADLLRRAIEQAPAGSVLHAVAEEGIATREIAEAIGRSLGVPAASLDPTDAAEHFGWIGMFFAADLPASNARTRELFDWTPVQQGLIADLDAGYYAARSTR